MNRIPIVSLIDYTKKGLREALGKKAVDFLNWEDFCWIKEKGERPVKNPEWPANFIKAVRCLAYEAEGLEEYKDLKYIFLNAGGDILKKIIADKIPVIIVMPKKFEGKYTPVEHYQDLNKKYLELDMPMVYLENEEEFMRVFSRESTYRYLKDKTEFVEGYRFGTCDFIEDFEEMWFMYETSDLINSIASSPNSGITYGGPFAIVRSSDNSTVIKDDLMEALETAGDYAESTPEIEYTVKDNEGEVICNVGFVNGEVMLRHPDSDRPIQIKKK